MKKRRRLKRLFKSKFQPGTFVVHRAWFVIIGFLICFAFIAKRATQIHIFPSARSSLNKIAHSQYQQRVKLANYRGTIFDRNGEAIAISIRKPSLYINPKMIEDRDSRIATVADILKMKKETVAKLFSQNSYFAWLKRKVSDEEANSILALGVRGIESVYEPARYYPFQSKAANLVGVVGTDDSGLSGLERQFNQLLSSEAKSILLAKDARGQPIVSTEELALPEKSGEALRISLDMNIQEIAEEELAAGVEKANAKGGFVIVTDPHTGNVLAMANYPNFNPNSTESRNLDREKNFALMNVFEPGSVIKPFVAALALEENLVRVDQKFDCENGVMQVGNRTIHDAHPPKTKYLTTSEIIMHSSNVCTYKIAKLLGQEKLHDGLQRFGFGKRETNLGFAGEGRGNLSSWNNWQAIRFANISFGQGMTASALELVQAYAAIANGGRLHKPTLIFSKKANSETKEPEIRRPVGSQTTKTIREILALTVEEAAVFAKPLSYTAAGKTGTSQKVDSTTGAYSHSKHLSTFIGMAPANDPHLVIYVQIDEPNKSQSYGSLWAAPVFAAVAEKTLQYLNVKPDRIVKEEKTLTLSKKPSNVQAE